MHQWTDDYEDVLRGHVRFVEPGTPIDPAALLALLGVDSLEIMGLIVDLEERLGLQLPEDILTPEVFATPGTLWAALEGHLNLPDRE